MLELGIVIALLVASIVVVLYQGIALLLAAQMPRLRPEDGRGLARIPKVSVVIAARNEEEDLPRCLDALLAQTYPNLEIVVVDGGSTDRTAEVARERGSRIRVLDEPPLPEGWVGKNWACQTGVKATDGEYVLFIDADVRCHPEAVRATIEWAEREQADLASLGPKVEMVGFWEKLVLPFYIQMVLAYFWTPRVNNDTSHTAMANGQYLLVRRPSYELVGGHTIIRQYVLEDVAIARAFRARGLRLRFAWSPELLTTRMYRDRKEMSEGILKNIHGMEFSAWRQVGFWFGLLGFYLLPLGVLPLGILTGNVLLIGMGAFLYFALFGKHAGLAARLGSNVGYGFLFPVAVAYYMGLVSVSLRRGLARRPVVWKGRNYPIQA